MLGSCDACMANACRHSQPLTGLVLRSAARAIRARQASNTAQLYSSLRAWVPLARHPPEINTHSLQLLQTAPDGLDDASLLQLYCAGLAHADPTTNNDVVERVEREATRRALADNQPPMLFSPLLGRKKLLVLTNSLAMLRPQLDKVPHTRAMLLRLLRSHSPHMRGKDVAFILCDCGPLGLRYNRPGDVDTIERLCQTVVSSFMDHHSSQDTQGGDYKPLTPARLCTVIMALACVEYTPHKEELNALCAQIAANLHTITSPTMLNKVLFALDKFGIWPSTLRIEPVIEQWLRVADAASAKDVVDVMRFLKGLFLARLIPMDAQVNALLVPLHHLLVNNLHNVDNKMLCQALLSLAHIKQFCSVGVISSSALWAVLEGRLSRVVELATEQQVIDLLWALPMLFDRPTIRPEALVAIYQRYGNTC